MVLEDLLAPSEAAQPCWQFEAVAGSTPARLATDGPNAKQMEGVPIEHCICSVLNDDRHDSRSANTAKRGLVACIIRWRQTNPILQY
jgi:hypothetical protein